MSEWDKKRSLMRRYDATADIYDMRYAGEQSAKIEAALEHLSIEKNKMVLDSGCGTGVLFSYVAHKVEAVVGIDFSRKTLLQAKKQANSSYNVHFILADVDNLPLKDNIFNNAFAMTLIQNSPDPLATLNELKRVSACDAEIVVTGMKKAFSLEAFEGLLLDAGLEPAFLEHEGLTCYVAICVRAC